MTRTKRKILLVSYYFPPSAEVGGIRPAKFAKFLPAFGWHPYILAVKDSYILSTDNSRLKDTENTTIFRTCVWKTPLEIAIQI